MAQVAGIDAALATTGGILHRRVDFVEARRPEAGALPRSPAAVSVAPFSKSSRPNGLHTAPDKGAYQPPKPSPAAFLDDLFGTTKKGSVPAPKPVNGTKLDAPNAAKPAAPAAGMSAAGSTPDAVASKAKGAVEKGAELEQPKRVLCSPSVVVPLLHWRKPADIGPGLQNLGNTCFLNSVIQCLTYTPALNQYLASGQHSRECTQTALCAPDVLRELSLIADRFGPKLRACHRPPVVVLPHVRDGGTHHSVHRQDRRPGDLAHQDRRQAESFGSPVPGWPRRRWRAMLTATAEFAVTLSMNTTDIAKHMRFGRQEDAHECTRYFVDGLLKSCLQGIDKYDPHQSPWFVRTTC